MVKMLRKSWQRFVAVVITVIMLATPAIAGVAAAAVQVGENAVVDVDDLNVTEYGSDDKVTQDLARLEPYVQYTYSNGIRLQTFDTNTALEEGFSKDVVLLAQEMVAFQNDMAKMAFARGIKDVTQLNISLQKYPRVANFFAQMTQQFESSKNNTTLNPSSLDSDPHPCGTYDHPVPSYTPTWYTTSSNNPEQELLNKGYHRTASYACEQGCTNNNGDWVDFTKGRSYTGPYGTCSSPRFRNHGRIQNSSLYAEQFGEPNPEIFSYVWPYWNWGAYVRWWHNNF
ncbi:MAG: hypothetical protein PWP44_1729 [Thermacetogenium sp.]|jgi:hypothetical protein|nr:hypothetical protein [Thermacetogenium sp.]